MKTQRVTPTEQQAIKLYRQGLSAADIARHFGKSREAARLNLKKLNDLDEIEHALMALIADVKRFRAVREG